MATLGLYYPFIHFKDDEWLKLAALYWDRMARIVPGSYPRSGASEVALAGDSEVAQRLAEKDAHFIFNVSPRETTYSLSWVFGELLTRHGNALRTRYGVQHRDAWPTDPITAAYAQLRDPRLAYVHSEKLDETLVQRFEAEGLAIGHREGDELWAGMHPRLAGVYMSALAEEVATVNQLNPTTDETLDHVAAAGWSLPRLAAALLEQPELTREADGAPDDAQPRAALDPESSSALGLISVRAVVPKDASLLTLEKVVHIRDQLGAERARFQRFIGEVGKDLPDFAPNADPAAIEAHLEARYETEVRPLMSELDAALRSAGVGTALTAVSTSIVMPPVVGALALPDPISATAAVGFSLAPVIRAGRRQAAEQYRQSPVAYLFGLREELEPRTVLGRVRAVLRRFLTGV